MLMPFVSQIALIQVVIEIAVDVAVSGGRA